MTGTVHRAGGIGLWSEVPVTALKSTFESHVFYTIMTACAAVPGHHSGAAELNNIIKLGDWS
jgi:hypothetical protein